MTYGTGVLRILSNFLKAVSNHINALLEDIGKCSPSSCPYPSSWCLPMSVGFFRMPPKRAIQVCHRWTGTWQGKQRHTMLGAFGKSQTRLQRPQSNCWPLVLGVGCTGSSSSPWDFFSMRFLRRITASAVVTAFLNLLRGRLVLGVGCTGSSSSPLDFFSMRFLRRITASVVVTAFLNFLRGRLRNGGLGGTGTRQTPSVLRRRSSARLVGVAEKA